MPADEPVTGQVSPDRVSTLEAEVAQLKVSLAETRGDVINMEGMARDLGQVMIQLAETHRETVLGLGRLTAHMTHDEAFRASAGASFCIYCTSVD